MKSKFICNLGFLTDNSFPYFDCCAFWFRFVCSQCSDMAAWGYACTSTS